MLFNMCLIFVDFEVRTFKYFQKLSYYKVASCFIPKRWDYSASKFFLKVTRKWIHFMPPVSFYTPSGFLIFSEGIERDQGHETCNELNFVLNIFINNFYQKYKLSIETPFVIVLSTNLEHIYRINLMFLLIILNRYFLTRYSHTYWQRYS